MARYVELSIATVDPNGADTTFSVNIDGEAPFREIHSIFGETAERLHQLLNVPPSKAQLPKGAVDEPQFPGLSAVFLRNAEEFEAWDYGVATMTPGEVQRLLEKKDRDLRIAREFRAKADRENEHLRDRLEAMRRDLDSADADLNIRRQDDHTRLQEERDIARKERDMQIRYNETLQKERDEAIAARKAADKQVNQLKDAAGKRVDKHVQQLQDAEARFQALKKDAHDQAEALGKMLVEATQKAKGEVSAGLGLPKDPMIHKSDVYEIIDGILQHVVPESAE